MYLHQVSSPTPAYSFDEGSLFEPRAGVFSGNLEACKPQQSPVCTSIRTGVTGIYGLFGTWVLISEEIRSLTDPDSLIRTDYLASKPPEFSCLDLPGAGITGMCCCTRLLCGCWRSEFRSSGLRSWHLPTVLSPQPQRLSIGKKQNKTKQGLLVVLYPLITGLSIFSIPALSSVSSLTTHTSA